jgi:ParB family chromosome partitioning protein
VSAVAQLAAFGLTPAQIAKKTRTKRADVDQAIAVQASELARKATARYDFLDLTQAAVVADFESEPETVKALIAAAKDGEFDHVAQRADDDRTKARAVADLTAELTAKGVRIVDPPTYGERGGATRLTSLADKGKMLTEAGHVKCPGRAAYVAGSYRSASAVYVCTDPKGNGHTDPYGASAAKASGPLSEAEKAERTTVRENNTAWRSAEAVRRTWLGEYATLKGATKEATAFLALAVLHGDHALRKGLEQRHRYAREILKLQHGQGGDPLANAMATATENRVTQLAVVAVLAAYEDSTGVHSWRNPDEATGRYLTYLAACGYTLSTVERLAIPKPVKAKTSRTRKTAATASSSPTQPTEAPAAGEHTPEAADGDLSATETAPVSDDDDLADTHGGQTNDEPQD